MTIDANMYWLPEELFTNEKMLEEFMRCIPEVYGVHARCEEVPGTTKKQIVLEEPELRSGRISDGKAVGGHG